MLGFAALAAVAPAHAQFMTNYPVIIVPPQQPQNMIVPTPSPSSRQLDRQYPPAVASPERSRCHYQGQTRVCD